MDSQSVKTANHGGIRGYDAGKRVVGRKRHLLVDSLGLILLVVVHPANLQDRDGAKILLRLLTERFGWLSKYRRMSKDYETTTESSVAMIHIGMTRLMLNRAARF